MAAISVESRLGAVEECLEAVSAAVLGGQPQVLESSAQRLRQAVTELYEGLHQAPAAGAAARAQVELRLKRIAEALGRQREAVVRRSIVVDRAIECLLPGASEPATYGSGAPAAASGNTPAARIFRAWAT